MTALAADLPVPHRRTGTAVTTRGRDPHFGLPAAAGFGERNAPSAFISRDGSDALAHLPQDDVAHLELDKMESLGKTLALALAVLGRGAQY